MNKDWSWARISDTFDAHVREQLPWYDTATTGVVHMVRAFLPNGGHVYDVGASTGNIGNAIAATLTERAADLTAIEPEPGMKYTGPGKLLRERVETVSPAPHDVSVWMLTLMFIPPHERSVVLTKFWNALRPGGCMIGIDRVCRWPGSGEVALAMERCSWTAKLDGGATAEAIVAKELQLSGIQRPIDHIPGDEWFRFGQFVGWVKTKPTWGGDEAWNTP